MQIVENFLDALWELNAEMAPYLLLGLAIAGVLHVYVRKETIQKYLGASTFKSVLYAAFIGVPLPLCSCGVIPTGVSFKREGASNGATVSFLISTPQTGVDSVLVTYSMMGLPFALLRPVIAFLTGLAGGVATNFVDEKIDASTSEPVCDGGDCCSTEATNEKNKFTRALHYAFVEFVEDIGGWLLIGLLIAAGIAVAIPDSFFDGYFGYSITSMLIVLMASVPLYVCATGSVPIAAMLLMKGLSPGTALVFLMAGPATNAATITVLSKTLGKKATVIYVGTIVIGALLFGLVIDLLLPQEWFVGHLSHHVHMHEHGLEWWKHLSAVVLTLLIAYALIQKYIISKYRKTRTIQPIETKIKESVADQTSFMAPVDFTGIGLVQEEVVLIDGMTCNHCKASVEKNVSALPGITSVDVNLGAKTAKITGSNIQLGKIASLIDSLGYKYKGKA